MVFLNVVLVPDDRGECSFEPGDVVRGAAERSSHGLGIGNRRIGVDDDCHELDRALRGSANRGRNRERRD